VPQPDAPGFFLGLVHGLFALFSLMASLILPIRPYAYPNAGLWYDAGFSLGVCSFVVSLVLGFAARVGGFITRGH
jgi:hypothetical protein